MRKAKLLTLALLMFSVGCEGNQPAPQSNASTIQAATGPVASDPVPDLPDYPGAKRVAYTTGSDAAQGFSKTVKTESVTSDPVDQVIEFYGKSLKNNGWKLANMESSVESVAEAKSRMTLTASKETSVAKIEIKEKGKGNVVITVERKEK